MSNRIYQPLIIPDKFYLIEPQDISQYVSKHMDDWLFKNTIRSYEQQLNFYRKWTMQDALRLQFVSNFIPLTLVTYDCSGKLMMSTEIDTKQQDYFNPNFFIRQVDFDFAAIDDEGYYYNRIPEANWISEPFLLAADKDSAEVQNTVYVEYKNSKFYQGVNFDVPYEPAIRLPGILKFKDTASIDTVYADQNQAETMLHSVPYRIWTFILGGQRGIPPWLKDKVSRIFGCDSLKIDGREFTKNEGATWESVDLDSYPMSGYSIELREKLNRDSLIYDSDILIPGMSSMMAVIDTKGFGMDDSGGDFLEITDVE